MFRPLVFALIILWSSPASAQDTATRLRDLAFAGNVEAVEAIFDDIEAQARAGAILPSELLLAVDAVSLSHPDLVSFTEDWIAAHPTSPHALTVGARQAWTKGWNLRGSQLAVNTTQIAV